MNKINKCKATGQDRISARPIRECADLICVPICDIFNQSISQGKPPEEWRSARVTPLFKQGDRKQLPSDLGYCGCTQDLLENRLRTIICLLKGARYTL